MSDDEVAAAEEILDAEVFTVDRLTVQTANGSRVERHVVRHPGTVAVVAKNVVGDVAMVHVFRPAVDAYRWELPAGRLDPGRSITEIAATELLGETGLVASSFEIAGEFFTTPGHSDHRTIIVQAIEPTAAKGGHRTHDEASMQSRWWTSAELEDLATAGESMDTKTCIGLYIAGILPKQETGIVSDSDADRVLALLDISTNRFIADNATIWTTGSIFIPASYAAPAIYLSIDAPSWFSLAGLATLSAVLSVAWS